MAESFGGKHPVWRYPYVVHGCVNTWVRCEPDEDGNTSTVTDVVPDFKNSQAFSVLETLCASKDFLPEDVLTRSTPAESRRVELPEGKSKG